MVSLDHRPIPVSFTSFDDFRHFRVDLKHKLLSVTILYGAHANVLQGDDALGYVLGRVLEIIKTPVIEDKPATLPAFPASALKWKMMVETFVISRSLVFYCIKVNRM